jgi:hypothetical protein
MSRPRRAEASQTIKIRKSTLNALNGKKHDLRRKTRRMFSQSDTIDWLILRADMEAEHIRII